MRKTVLLALLLLMALVPTVVAAEDSLTIRVGVYDNPPKVYMEDGEAKGLWADVIEYMAEEEGWEIEYVYGDWKDGLDRLESGVIDVFMDVAWSAERAEKYDFPEEDIVMNWAKVYTRKDAGIESILDLQGKRIAVMEGGIHYIGPNGLKNTLGRFDIHAEFMELGVYEDIFVLVGRGAVDAGVVNRIYGLTHEEQFNVEPTTIIFNPVGLRFALTKGNSINPQLIERMDFHVKRMKMDPHSVYYKSVQEHFGGHLTEETEVLPVWAEWLMLAAIVLLAFFLWTSIILKEKHEFQRTLLDQSPVPIVTLDAKGRFVSVNEAFIKKIGYTKRDLAGKHFMKSLAPEYTQNAAAAFARLMGGGAPMSIEIGIVSKPGKKEYYRASGELLKMKGKTLVVAVLLDVTEKKELWEKLRAIEKRRGKK